MTEAMWTALSGNIMTLAGYAITAGLLVFGLIAGMRVAKKVFGIMAGVETSDGEYDDSDERSEAWASEYFANREMPGLMSNGYEDKEGYYESRDFLQDDEEELSDVQYENSHEFNDR